MRPWLRLYTPTRNNFLQERCSPELKLAPHRSVSNQWQGRGDLNSQPLVLETSALPIELHPCKSAAWSQADSLAASTAYRSATSLLGIRSYLSTFVTTPEPTVRPPSRMANRTLASMAIGEINSTLSFTLSPGMHISASPSRLAVPVTSVVRK